MFSEEKKFILPIPSFEGEALVYPDSHEFAGQTIQYQKEGACGVRWWNDITHEWQGVTSDGTGLVVINQINFDEAEMLQEWITKNVSSPDHLGIETVREFVMFAKEATGKCVYNASKQSFLSSVNVVKWHHQTDRLGYGLHQRQRDDIFKAYIVYEPFMFEPAGKQFFPEGCVIVSSIKNPRERCVLAHTFANTYRLYPDGDEILLEKMPRHIVTF